MNSLKRYITVHHAPLGLVGAVVAASVAVLYFIVVPGQTESASGVIKLMLLYGHSVCWLLIATASGIWALKGANSLSTRLLYAALIAYVLFLVSMML
jgi:hypothetical protein